MSSGAVLLMYHELEVPGRPTANSDPGYLRYVVPAGSFRKHLQRLNEAKARTGKVSDLVQASATPDLVITFDDGAETDLTAAAPVLSEFGYSACFYIVAAWTGKPGFLSVAQLRELASHGFEVGSHSLTHRYLSALGEDGLEAETIGSKRRLEDILGQAVDHFSCPGGRWNETVIRAAKRAGYKSMAISRVGRVTLPIKPFELNRVAVPRTAQANWIEKLASGRGLWTERARAEILGGAKAMFGDSTYDRLRSSILRGCFRR